MANALFVNAGRCLIAACKSETYTQHLHRVGSTIIYAKQEKSWIDEKLSSFTGKSLDRLINELDAKGSEKNDSIIIGGRSPNLLSFYNYSFRHYYSALPQVSDSEGNELPGPAQAALARFSLSKRSQLQLCFLNERGARVLYSPEIRIHLAPDEYRGSLLAQEEAFEYLLSCLVRRPEHIYEFTDRFIKGRC